MDTNGSQGMIDKRTEQFIKIEKRIEDLKALRSDKRISGEMRLFLNKALQELRKKRSNISGHVRKHYQIRSKRINRLP